MKKLFNNTDSQEREYVRILKKYVLRLRKNTIEILFTQLNKILLQYKIETRADSWVDVLSGIINELIRFSDLESNFVVSRLKNQFEAVSIFNDRQFKAVFKANTGVEVPDNTNLSESRIGVNVFRYEPYLLPIADGWIKENTALIKSIPTKIHTEIDAIITRGVINGVSVNDIKKSILSRFNVSKNRAKLIAQDQTLKLNSDLTRYRLKSIGVNKYIWRTVNDNRVREAHNAREGNIYSFDKPPVGGQNPGQEIRCRCRAEAIFTDDE
jgi:SPP1 gp7 family putative phage head morphogenesis protein